MEEYKSFVPKEAEGFKLLRNDGKKTCWYHIRSYGVMVGFKSSERAKTRYKGFETTEEAEKAMDKWMENY